MVQKVGYQIAPRGATQGFWVAVGEGGVGWRVGYIGLDQARPQGSGSHTGCCLMDNVIQGIIWIGNVGNKGKSGLK